MWVALWFPTSHYYNFFTASKCIYSSHTHPLIPAFHFLQNLCHSQILWADTNLCFTQWALPFTNFLLPKNASSSIWGYLSTSYSTSSVLSTCKQEYNIIWIYIHAGERDRLRLWFSSHYHSCLVYKQLIFSFALLNIHICYLMYDKY